MLDMEPDFELPDGRKVEFTEQALDGLDGDHDNCAFCLGRHAAHRGDGRDTNPFDDVPDGETSWYDTDYGLWRAGHDLGSTEPGGLLWFQQPNRDATSGN
jgi:hypothetical protein